ncbi:MAG: hypothetical protein A2Z47_13140 [Thermodesulfovibrio sp. RBG_19FT_COMBO_42_12]|nr:MAG: hypothetical protein A2Z47_13140 [Thermodesulfovibrio sp. RBG_19FT_COMBO_42_12]
MAKAKKSKQLSFTMPNRVGLLSEITTAMAKAKISITGICAYAMEGKAYFMLMTDSNAKAKKALSALAGNIKEEDVVSVELPNKAGTGQQVAKRIADAGVDIIYMYGTAGTGRTSICVFKTGDDKKAIKVINK